MRETITTIAIRGRQTHSSLSYIYLPQQIQELYQTLADQKK